MRTRGPRQHDVDRVPRAVAEARRLVASHNTPSALRVLSVLGKLNLEQPLAFEIEALRAQTLIDQGRFDDAGKYIRQASAIAITDHQLDEIVLLQAHRFARMANSGAALRGAFDILRRSDSSDHRARAHWITGVGLYRAGHYRWARNSFELACAHYRISKDPTKLAQVLENIALVVKNQGRVVGAIEYLDQALDLYPKRGFWRLRSYCQLHRGICFLRLGRIEHARISLLESRRLAMRAGLEPVHVAAQNHLGHIYRMQGDASTAVEFHQDALRLARELKAPRKIALALEFLAETLCEQGRPGEAHRMLTEALGIATQLARGGDLVMEILRRRGEASLMLGDRDSGLEDLRRAASLCAARGEVREQFLAQRALHLATATSASDLAAGIERVLSGLAQVGDTFEYARTVCLASEDDRVVAVAPQWLFDAQATAAYYFKSMGLSRWSKRLQGIAGHSVRIPVRVEVAHDTQPSAISTASPRFADALDAARLAARSSDPALILGETGAGKEVIARFIHQTSARAARPLIAINCGAIPANLIESELFGHVRGAFTGAERDRAGLFETADGGTVLLDEIGDLPADVQVKLLRFLDHYQFHRIGEHRSRTADVRILAATHKDMAELVQQGMFRKDLYFRLNVFAVEVPALRDRREDIPALVELFLRPEAPSTPQLRLTPDLMRWFEAYAWPGNVRELRNLCRYLAVRCWGKSAIEPRDLPPQLRDACREFLSGEPVSAYERERLELERTQLKRALQQSGGSIIAAGRLLGMHRNVVAQRMREHGITRESFRKPL